MKNIKFAQVCLASVAVFALSQGFCAQKAAHDDDITIAATETTDGTTENTNAAKSKHYLSDAAITARVKEKYIQEKLFDKKNISAMGIHVKTIDGIVHLSGKVKDKAQEENAISIAKTIEGVKDVKSTIKVKEEKK